MSITFATAFSLAQAKLYEIEQAQYWVMQLTRESARRKDNLSFKARKTGYLDVMLNPLWVVCVADPLVEQQNVFARDKVNQYIRAINTRGN